jgi:hypothetical protein
MKPRRVQQTAANSGGCFFFGIPLLRRPTSTASYFFPLHIIFCGLLLALSSSSSFFTHAEKQTAK